MKILLTGRPGVGKTGIIKRFTRQLKRPIAGVYSQEIRDEAGQRIGFEARNFSGEKRIFSHVSKVNSAFKINNKYAVDLSAIDDFVVPELERGSRLGQLVIIDEIGRMQVLSKNFIRTTLQLLNSDLDVLGTIVGDAEDWSMPFKETAGVVLLEVSVANRDFLPTLLVTAFSHSLDFAKLNPVQQRLAMKLFRDYVHAGRLVQINKLFNNAILYVAAQRVHRREKTASFVVTGNHGEHYVRQTGSRREWQCDCDLFLGKGEYLHHSGECSHIQAARLSLAPD